MSRAFMKESEPGEPRCPACKGIGIPVGAPTLEAQLPAEFRAKLVGAACWCESAECRTAYFDAWGTAVGVDRLRSIPHPKDPEGPICFCFGLSAAQITADARDGRKERVKDLKERAEGPEARCTERCPDGRPCLPRVMRLFRESFEAR